MAGVGLHGRARPADAIHARPRVVVVGAGFGGLNVAKGLRRTPVDVLILDANNFHTFQPLLYQVATAGLDADDIASSVRGSFRRSRAVRFRLGAAEAVDLERRVVCTEDGAEVPYDHLVLATGAESADFGIPGVAEHAFPMKGLEDALRLRNHVLGCFEEANRLGLGGRPVDPSLLTVVVAGGGPTGVEVAGAMVELFDKVLAGEFHGFDAGRARVVLVEGADRLLGAFHPHLAARARQVLVRRGVEVRLGAMIDRVEPGAVHLVGGDVIRAATLVWAAGVRASPLGAALGVPLARGGRVPVDEQLRLPGHPEVRIIGDLAAAAAIPLPTRPGAGGADGGPAPVPVDVPLLPQLAPVAIQQARYVAAAIAAEVTGSPPPPGPFRFHDRGVMATIGRAEAVAQLPHGVRFAGFPGWLAWLGLHLVMLIGFRNRANVLVNWAWNYLTYDRGARLIVGGAR